MHSQSGRPLVFRQSRKNTRSAINKAIAVPVFAKSPNVSEIFNADNELRDVRKCKPKADYVKSMSALAHTDYVRQG
jgi:hypothetical protein